MLFGLAQINWISPAVISDLDMISFSGFWPAKKDKDLQGLACLTVIWM